MRPVLLHRFAATLLACTLPLAAQCDLQWHAGDPIPSPRGQVAGSTLWDPDGAGPLPVNLVVCGRFAAGDQAACSVARYDGKRWTALGGWMDLGSAITVHNGSLVVVAGGLVRRWTGSAWQSLGTVMGAFPSDSVRAMTVFAGDLVIAGSFSSVDGVQTGGVARWNGSVWSALDPVGITGAILAVAVYTWQGQPALYVGGYSLQVGGVSVPSLAVWTSSGWGNIQGPSGSVWSLAVRTTASALNSYLLMGGNFTAVGPLQTPVQYVARFNDLTGDWSALGALPAHCRALCLRNLVSSADITATAFDHKVYRWAGGGWAQVGAAPGVQALNTIQSFGGRYVVGWGASASSGGIVAPVGNEWLPLAGSLDGTVRAAIADAGGTTVAGEFRTADGALANGVAVGGPGNWQVLGNGVTGGVGAVHALVPLPNGDLVAGGSFASSTGGAGNGIARWDGAAWQPFANGLNGTVHALAVLPNGDLVAGGEFTAAGGTTALRIARWNGGFWSSLGTGVNGIVNALVVATDGDLFVGGTFAMAGGLPAANVARYDGAAWWPLSSGTDGAVLALAALPAGGVVAGGAFATAGGVPVQRVARWQGSWTGLAMPPLAATVRALAVLADDSIVIGGDRMAFSHPIYGQVEDNTIRVDGGTLEPLGVGASAADTVFAATRTTQGGLLIGGAFENVLALTSANVAVMAPACPASAVAYGAGCVGSGGTAALTAITLPWQNTMFRSRATGMPGNGVAVVVFGFSPVAVPISLFLPEGLPGCDLLTSLEITAVGVPVAGVFDTAVFLAPSPSLVGVTLYHQVGAVEVNGSQISAISTTNGLALTVGSY